ncbi:MAG: DUF3617 domain-containing protein [Pseudomonadota bacterium]|nr:MAG: DUF3617 domain-containing protein [Pseudomonadota bacterium]
MKLRNATLAFLLASVSLQADAAPDVRPGMWETTVKTEMPGMPGAMPPMTHRYCLRKEDLVPKTNQPGQECKMVENKLTGNTMTWRVRCESRGTVSNGTGNITYSGNTYKGTIEIEMSEGGGQPVKMIQHLEGKRVGDCK